MNFPQTLCICALLLVASSLRAQPIEDLTLKAATPADISGTGATSASVDVDNGSSVSNIPVSGLTFTSDKATLSAAQVDALIAATSASGVRGATLNLRDASGNLVKRYRLAVPRMPAGAPIVVANTPGGKATVNDCDSAAANWKRNNPDWKDGRSVLVLFTASGQYCPDRSTRVVRRGDDIYVGIVSRGDDKVEKVDVQFSPCDAEDAEPNIYISTKVPSQFAKQAATDIAPVNIYDTRRCYNSTTRITAAITPSAGGAAINAERSLNLNARYRGTLQIGALYTNLHENSFALRDNAGHQVIYNKEAENKGPEYVANVLVYGLPRYLSGDGWKGGYKGRDILNDYDWRDRVGLIFSAGLKDPGDRFGTGLSFELAYGINVFWTKHWYRQRELVGLKIGDEFSGAVDTLPIQRNWESASSWGLSFDMRYLTALFDRK